MKQDFLKLLRRLWGKLRTWRRHGKLKRYLRKPKADKVFILGSPLHSNLGDSAILIAQAAFLEKVVSSAIKEAAFSEYYADRHVIRRYISSHQLICGLGGGNMGNQWPAEERLRYDILNDFRDNPIIIFPQSIYYIEDGRDRAECASVPYYNGRPGLTLIARERTSYDIMRRLYPDTSVLLAPDIVLSATMETFGAVPQERRGALLCVRSDVEKAVPDSVWKALENELWKRGVECRKTDMHAARAVTKENRPECVRDKMQEFCAVKLVVTDRLHGMIFAAVTGTPCIAFSNYNHKVRGTYEWIKYLPYIKFAETPEQARTYIPELLEMRDCHYDNTPLLPYFEKIAEVVREKCPPSA